MKASEAIKFALQMSENIAMSSIDDMKDAPLTFPTPNGGCHPLWILGHLTLTEGLLRETLLGEPNPVAEWKELFDIGSEPSGDASRYPSFDEIREKYNELRAENLKLFDSLSEEDLDKPTKKPPQGLEQFFDTFGHAFLTVASHAMAHRGQVADARRALERKPLFM